MSTRLSTLTIIVLVLSSLIVATQLLTVNPSLAQDANSNGIKTCRPYSALSVSTSTSVTTLQSSNTISSHGRKGGLPPGLVGAWARSNMSVVARNVTHAIFLSGYHGVVLAWIAINASSSNQLIESVAFNETVFHLRFDQEGAVILSVQSSAKPTAVYADDIVLREAPSMAGLTPESEAWVYDQSSQVIIIFADPFSITLFYGYSPPPIPEFPSESIVAGLAVGIAMLALLTRRGRKPSAKYPV